MKVPCRRIESYSCGDSRPRLSHRLLHLVNIFNLSTESLRDRIALDLAVRRQQAVLNSKWLGADPERPHLLVVREASIHLVEGGLHTLGAYIARHDGGKIAATVAN